MKKDNSFEDILNFFTQKYEEKGKLFVNESRLALFLERVYGQCLVVSVWQMGTVTRKKVRHPNVSLSYTHKGQYQSFDGTFEEMKVKADQINEKIVMPENLFLVVNDHRTLCGKLKIIAPSKEDLDKILIAYRISVGKENLTPEFVSYGAADHLNALVRQLWR